MSSKKRPRRAGRSGRTRRARRPHGRMLAVVLVAIAVVAFLLVAVFPTRTLLAQRSDTADAKRELAELDKANAALDRRIEHLQTPEEIERIARKEYGLVRDGEEAYAILPAPAPPVELPDIWPFQGVADELNR